MRDDVLHHLNGHMPPLKIYNLATRDDVLAHPCVADLTGTRRDPFLWSVLSYVIISINLSLLVKDWPLSNAKSLVSF